MYVRCDESSLYSGLTITIALTGNFLRECPGIIKTMHTGFSVHVLCIGALKRPGADTEETGRYDLAWKDWCSVLNALSK